MPKLSRHSQNPILLPSITNEWEAAGAFNGSVVKFDQEYKMVYRALSDKKLIGHNRLQVSTVGCATSKDGYAFSDSFPLIVPEHHWEMYGCEDPRVTKFGDKYYIFYTALATYPFTADGIKVAVAITKDFKTIEEKHLVTPFNAKAMGLFPEKVNGKYAVILAANTDIPPAKISIALLDNIEELWSSDYWQRWYAYLDDHTLDLLRSPQDQVEVGAVPIKTDKGWLLIYSYIKNYFSDKKDFTIEAALLDSNNPQKVLAVSETLLHPEKDYEFYGNVPNIAFPSGAIVKNDDLLVYYGGADTCTCVATCNFEELLTSLAPVAQKQEPEYPIQFKRFEEDPILLPIAEHAWESKAVFNPAAVYERGKIYIIYRAMGEDDTSVLGLAVSSDGYHIDERLPYPIYLPREPFEKKVAPHVGSGCEDPRITKIDDRYYLQYTAYDGKNAPKVAMSSISIDDFVNYRFDKWSTPILITKPDEDNKDCCLFPRKVNGKYVFIHRVAYKDIWIDYVDDLEFKDRYLEGEVFIARREDGWDKSRIGAAGPPIETKAGWVFFYHGVGDDNEYKVGAVLLDLDNPSKVLKRLDYPLLSPDMHFEREGLIPNVAFPCGGVEKDGLFFTYYGGADKVTGVATIEIDKLVEELTK